MIIDNKEYIHKNNRGKLEGRCNNCDLITKVRSCPSMSINKNYDEFLSQFSPINRSSFPCKVGYFIRKNQIRKKLTFK